MSAGPDKVIRDEIRAITAYHVQPAEGLVKLDAMENPYRLPEALRRAVAEAVADAEFNRYPDPTAPALVKRLREIMAIGSEYGVLLGNGSDEIIHIIIQSVARPGAVVLAPRPSFFMFSLYAQLAGPRLRRGAGQPGFHGSMPASSCRRWPSTGLRSCSSPIRTIRPATCSRTRRSRPSSPRRLGWW